MIISNYHEFRGFPHDPQIWKRIPGSFLAITGPTRAGPGPLHQRPGCRPGRRRWFAGCQGRQHQKGLRICVAPLLRLDRPNRPSSPCPQLLRTWPSTWDTCCGRGKNSGHHKSQARAAISHAHAAEGISQTDNPARHPVVAETMKGWRNQAPAPTQVDALTAPALARIRETARLPRRGRGGNMESAQMAQARGAVDLAIVGVMSDGGLRRSEARRPDVGRHRVLGRTRRPASPSRRGRTQPEPATVAVTETTARALREIQPDDTSPAASLFGLTGQTLANRIRRRRQRRRPGRGFQWTQRPDRHGPANGGRRSSERCGPESRTLEARRHGGPLHPGQSCGGGPEVADLAAWLTLGW